MFYTPDTTTLIEKEDNQSSPDVDLSGFPVREGVRSIKYWVECGSFGGSLFAPDPVEARNKAIETFELPVDADIQIYRMREPGDIVARIN